ncbi:hypothetical protein PV10_03483 [Exophiala mesophila]|uniref:N-acetyltransferase domain-containing protein n=1 Tax=Exophiala mesophila TaxID=212818 RepID=A0A0D1ZMK8_EXOME|nr:uncharacterized protein PV10_03483 [Exophiala mesophila]KIV95882.1 hypothetical protein PV10_03483 [Exophiala mesophila]
MDAYTRKTKLMDVMAAHWRRYNFVLTTDPKRMPPEQLNTLLESKSSVEKRYPTQKLDSIMQHSLIFALLMRGGGHGNRSRLIGFARFLTNQVTVAFFEELVLLPECHDLGIIPWMGHCMNEYFEAMGVEAVVAVVDTDTDEEVLLRRHLNMHPVGAESRVELIKLPPQA